MGDHIDRAQDCEQLQREEALARRRPAPLPGPHDAEALDCADCGDPIPPERLKAVKTERCTTCAALAEKGTRR